MHMVAIAIWGCDVCVGENRIIQCFAENCTKYAETERGEEGGNSELQESGATIHPLVVWTTPARRPVNPNRARE